MQPPQLRHSSLNFVYDNFHVFNCKITPLQHLILNSAIKLRAMLLTMCMIGNAIGKA